MMAGNTSVRSSLVTEKEQSILFASSGESTDNLSNPEKRDQQPQI